MKTHIGHLPGGGYDGGVQTSITRDGHRQRDEPARITQHLIGKRLYDTQQHGV